MSRRARHFGEGCTVHHVYNRCAGHPKYFPFKDPVAARKITELVERYVGFYSCEMSAFELMDNHIHFIVHFEEYRELDRSELERRARLRFGRRWKLKTGSWSDAKWEDFNQRLFKLDCLMQHIEGEFTKWFNPYRGRCGGFWAGRYKNTELLGRQAVQDTILYIELNAVRAGLVKRPEDFKRSSANWRHTGRKSDLLMPLEKLFPGCKQYDSFTSYRSRLYLRGAVASKDNTAVIPEAIVREEEDRGFKCPGAFKRRLRCFTDGIALGTREQVGKVLDNYIDQGIYKRRRNPIAQLGGLLFTLREQRSHAHAPG